MSNSPLLEVIDIFAGYVKDLDILQGLNFCVYPGELIAIIGPNGCGKSTSLKTVMGLLNPGQGKIIFKGENIAGLKSDKIVKKGICYVPQIANVFPNLTIDENLEMGAFILNTNLQPLKDKIYTIFPDLANRKTQRAGSLSGGQRQMVAMGKALMLEPTLLLLDEPSAALSPILVNQVLEQIKKINQNGTSILLVEQNAKKALEIADRGYVLESGRDRFEGKGIDLLNDPKVGELYLGTKTIT
ncbi:MAG TPA: ABC transporter ATP-binding protein [Allocoleopsis sp.]